MTVARNVDFISDVIKIAKNRPGRGGVIVDDMFRVQIKKNI
jgi:hypothetical protein